MQALLQLDIDLFLFLNSLHSNTLDPIMAFVTSREVWFPCYMLLILWLLVKKQMKGVFMLASILLAVIVSDQICSSLLKPLVGRLRPCHSPELKGLVHLVTECGGRYSFCSSHAANSFALATSLYLFLGRNIFTLLVFIWAIIVSYSRIYVGVHYPADVLAGAAIGSLCAYLCFLAVCRANPKYFS